MKYPIVIVGAVGGEILSGERSKGELARFSRLNPYFANKMRRILARPGLNNSGQPIGPQAGLLWPLPGPRELQLWARLRAELTLRLRGMRKYLEPRKI